MSKSLFHSPLSLMAAAFSFNAYTRYMTDSTPVAAPVDPTPPAEPATGAGATADAAQDVKEAGASDEQPASVAVDVPAEHVGLLTRLVAVLKRDEQWIVDNIHAGVVQLENIFKESDEAQKDQAQS